MQTNVKIIPKSFLHGFVLKSTLIFAGGALLAAIVFYFALPGQGTSYADSYKLMAELDNVLVEKSLILFSFTLLLSVAGIIILAILYSHRVAGALHKLGMHTRKIASGDLTASVRLRNTDVIHELADDLNAFSGHYRSLLLELGQKLRELEAVMNNQEKGAPQAGEADPSREISERIDEIRARLNQIKL